MSRCLYFFVERVKTLIEGAGKQREVFEELYRRHRGFNPTPDTFIEIEVGGKTPNTKLQIVGQRVIGGVQRLGNRPLKNA